MRANLSSRFTVISLFVIRLLLNDFQVVRASRAVAEK